MTTLWKYTASKAAPDWVAAAAYVVATEDALPAVEEVFKVRINAPASADEIASSPHHLEYRPGYPLKERRKFVGGKDVTYRQLVAQGKTDEAIERADALIRGEVVAPRGR